MKLKLQQLLGGTFAAKAEATDDEVYEALSVRLKQADSLPVLAKALGLEKPEEATSSQIEGAILAHLRLNHALVPGAWMKSTELALLFGNVYPHIRYLTKIGLVEMMQREEPIYGPRGGRDSFWYRWNGVGKRDVIVEKLRAF